MSDKVIWKSNGMSDYIWYEATDDEIIEQAQDYGYDLEDGDVDALRSKLADIESDTDYDDLKYNIAPEIDKQCPYSYLWLVGNYQRWDGGHSAIGFYTDASKGIISVCYPNYDSTSELYYNDEGNLSFTESSHDAPMGGTEMVLYRLRDEQAVDEIENLKDEYGDWYSITYSGDDPDAIYRWVEKGLLVPIKSLG